MRNKNFIIVPIFFTIFLDLLGLGIVIPILPAVLLDKASQVLPFSYDFSTRTLIYGFLTASYPLAQFFGAPILGTLADQYGRKKLLSISLIGTMVGYILFALGIVYNNIYLLFIGRILDGFTGGNISIAQSAIADISTPETKSRNFGLIGMAFGLGFIIGPYIGGKLADPSVVAWFTYATPFWLSVVLTLLNILLVLWYFPETLVSSRKVKVSALTGIRNIKKAFAYKDLRTMFFVGFLLTVGFNFFTQFFQVFLIGKFHFDQSQIGDLFAFMGIWIALAQGIVLRPLSKKYKPITILSVSIVLLALAFPLLLLPNKSFGIYLIVPFISVFQGLTQPNSIAIISNLASSDEQGEVLGINQSIMSLAQAIPPIIAGFVTSISLDLPIIFAGGSTLVAWFVFKLSFIKQQKLKTLDS